MSVVGTLDAIAVKANGIAGLKQAYAVGVSVARPIPRNIDDTPVATVWIGAGEMEGGNAEHVTFYPTLDIWCAAENAAWANKTLTQFIDLARTAFRTDMNMGGEATRCHMVGWGEPEVEDIGERTFLVLPIQLSVLITRYGADATS